LNECRKFFRKSYNLDSPVGAVTDDGKIEIATSFGVSNGNTIATIQTERMYSIPEVTLYNSSSPPVKDYWFVSTLVKVGMTTDKIGENNFVIVNDSGFSISTSNVGGHYVAEVTSV